MEIRGGRIRVFRECFDIMGANDLFCGDDQTKIDLGIRSSD
jgi:hypothetical protein